MRPRTKKGWIDAFVGLLPLVAGRPGWGVTRSQGAIRLSPLPAPDRRDSRACCPLVAIAKVIDPTIECGGLSAWTALRELGLKVSSTDVGNPALDAAIDAFTNTADHNLQSPHFDHKLRTRILQGLGMRA